MSATIGSGEKSASRTKRPAKWIPIHFPDARQIPLVRIVPLPNVSFTGHAQAHCGTFHHSQQPNLCFGFHTRAVKSASSILLKNGRQVTVGTVSLCGKRSARLCGNGHSKFSLKIAIISSYLPLIVVSVSLHLLAPVSNAAFQVFD